MFTSLCFLYTHKVIARKIDFRYIPSKRLTVKFILDYNQVNTFCYFARLDFIHLSL